MGKKAPVHLGWSCPLVVVYLYSWALSFVHLGLALVLTQVLDPPWQAVSSMLSGPEARVSSPNYLKKKSKMWNVCNARKEKEQRSVEGRLVCCPCKIKSTCRSEISCSISHCMAMHASCNTCFMDPPSGNRAGMSSGFAYLREPSQDCQPVQVVRVGAAGAKPRPSLLGSPCHPHLCHSSFEWLWLRLRYLRTGRLRIHCFFLFFGRDRFPRARRSQRVGRGPSVVVLPTASERGSPTRDTFPRSVLCAVHVALAAVGV